MHHHPPNQERALNLSILPVSGPAPRLEAAIVRCSSSTECCQEFPAADPDRSGWNPTLQVPDSASVFDLKIPPPDLRPEIRPSRSSSEDIEALNPIVLDTTEPYQTTIMLSHADTRLPRNVSFEKAQIPSYAEATAIENLPRTSPPAVSSQHTMFAHDSSPEATGSTTSGSSAVPAIKKESLYLAGYSSKLFERNVGNEAFDVKWVPYSARLSLRASDYLRSNLWVKPEYVIRTYDDHSLLLSELKEVPSKCSLWVTKERFESIPEMVNKTFATICPDPVFVPFNPKCF
ncbi:hypothetical protein MRX96_031181 [Rhipicephalus microplus]